MASSITLEELQNLRTIITSASADKQLAAASSVYTYLLDKGFMYAGWGRGVVNEDTTAGIAAISFVEGK
jgi:hypothetical protein